MTPRPSPSHARRNATLACLLALALWLWLRGLGPAIAVAVSGTLALLAWVVPSWFVVVQRGLAWGPQLVLRALTWLLLGAIHGGVLLPLRLMRSLVGSDPLRRRRDPHADTYFEPVRPETLRRFERQF